MGLCSYKLQNTWATRNWNGQGGILPQRFQWEHGSAKTFISDSSLQNHQGVSSVVLSHLTCDNLLCSHRKLMSHMNNPLHIMASQLLRFLLTNDLLLSSSATLSHGHTLKPCFQTNHSPQKPPTQPTVSLAAHLPACLLTHSTALITGFNPLFLFATIQLKFQDFIGQCPRLSCPCHR